MFFWFNQKKDHNNKLPKVSTKNNSKHFSNNQKHNLHSEKNKTAYPRYSPLPAINSKYPYRKLERQKTYVVTNPVFVKPSKQRKKPMTFKEFKKGLNNKNKNDKDENGLMWVQL